MDKKIKLVWIVGLSSWLAFILFIICVNTNFLYLFGGIPPIEFLENPKGEVASELYTSDGIILGKYFRTNRSNLDYNEISPNVINCLIATEDERFTKHSGIDFRATLRVITGLLTLNTAGGGSTVTQQLAKNLFSLRDMPEYRGPLYKIPGLRMLIIKVKEWKTAILLERSYTKQEIITMYLNTVQFGNNTFGINVASHTYFNKAAINLSIQEAAVLVGILKGNTLYNPIQNPENAFNRRNTVIKQLYKSDYISKTQKDSLYQTEMLLDYQPDSYSQGLATYFRAVIKLEVIAICKAAGYDLFTDGLKIYTTIDSKMQTSAEKAMKSHMKYLQNAFLNDWGSQRPWDGEYIWKELKKTETYKALQEKHNKNTDAINAELKQVIKQRIFTWEGETDSLISPLNLFIHNKMMLHAGLLSVNPHNGKIMAWVGGIDYKNFPYDHVKQSSRQPGSAFKPILYSTAINAGYTPCTSILDGPISIKLDDGTTWTPNSEPTGQMINLKTALAQSLNNVAANLIRDVGPQNVIDHAAKLGIPSKKLDPVLSLALGTSPISLYELVYAYNVFVNGGVYKEPVYIEKITDKNGKIIYQSNPKSHIVMSPENAYKMVSMLIGNTTMQGGTGLSLKYQYNLVDDYNQIGGKTGTTQRSTDGWYVGITKDLVTGCWVGGDDNKIHVRSGGLGQGSRMALPIFANYHQQLYNKKLLKKGPFPIPTSMDTLTLATQLHCKENLTPTNDGETLLFNHQNTDEE